eukprot:s647_g3.t1
MWRAARVRLLHFAIACRAMVSQGFSRIPVAIYTGAQKKGMKLAMGRRKDCAAATGCCEREEPPVPADGDQQAIEDLEETPSDGADKTVMLGGVPVKMDHLGPVIVNDDGSMRRIANWILGGTGSGACIDQRTADSQTLLRIAAGPSQNRAAQPTTLSQADCGPLRCFLDGDRLATYSQDCPVGRWTDAEGLSECAFCPAGRIGLQAGQSLLENACSSCSPGRSSEPGGSSCFGCAAGTWAAEGSECLPCPSGRWSSTVEATNLASCQQCDPGRFNQQIGASSINACEQCALGTWNNQLGASECANCTAGRFLSSVGATAVEQCLACGTGRASTAGARTCEDCPPGRHAPDETSASCIECSAGSYSQEALSSSCVSCAAGRFSSQPGASNGEACQDCIPGRFSLENSSQCEECEPGGWSGFVRQTRCEQCAAGTASSQRGATTKEWCLLCGRGNFSLSGAASCSPCPAGRAANLVGASACEKCAAGRYTSTEGATECEACPSGRSASSTGSSSEEACEICPPGRLAPEVGAASCDQCQPGRWQQLPGATGCNLCPPGTSNSAPGGSSDSLCAPCGLGLWSGEGMRVERNRPPARFTVERWNVAPTVEEKKAAEGLDDQAAVKTMKQRVAEAVRQRWQQPMSAESGGDSVSVMIFVAVGWLQKNGLQILIRLQMSAIGQRRSYDLRYATWSPYLQDLAMGNRTEEIRLRFECLQNTYANEGPRMVASDVAPHQLVPGSRHIFRFWYDEDIVKTTDQKPPVQLEFPTGTGKGTNFGDTLWVLATGYRCKGDSAVASTQSVRLKKKC